MRARAGTNLFPFVDTEASSAPPQSVNATALTVAKEWQLLAVLASVQFTHIMDFMVMMPLGPQFMRIFHLTPAQFGWLVSSYTLTAAVAGFFAAFRLDRYDRKLALLVLYGCFTAATLLCALAPGYLFLLIARAVAGAFGGVLNAVIQSFIGDAIAPQRRGRATGTVAMGFSLSAVAGVPVGLFLANHFGWRATFLAVAVMAVLVWFAALRVLPSLRAHVAPGNGMAPLAKLRLIFGERNHRFAFMLAGSLMFGGFSVIPFLSPYLVGNTGLLETQLPYVYLAGGLATLLTSRAIGMYADAKGKRHAFTVIALISIIPILLVTNLPHLPLPYLIAATTLMFIFVSGRYVPAIALINASVAPRHRGSLMSFVSAIQSACSAFAALAAGYVIERTPSGTLLHYGWVGAFAVGMTLLAVFWSRKIRLIDDR
jgi:predicted MFS family arabinose efflux permease